MHDSPQTVTLDFTSTKIEQDVNFKENPTHNVLYSPYESMHLTLVINTLHSGSISRWLSTRYTPAGEGLGAAGVSGPDPRGLGDP